MHPLRRRLENSDLLAQMVGRSVAGWLRLCLNTIRWEERGLEEVRAALAEGPVIIVVWHSRFLLCPGHFEKIASFVTLADPSPAGRAGAVVQARFGMEPISIRARSTGAGTMREVLRRLKDGQSVGMTADGPEGPARVMKSVPLDWSRVSGAPIFLYAYSCTRQRRLRTWDRILLPLPFGRGRMEVRRWERALPRRPSAEEAEALRAALEADLNAHQAGVDAALGLPPGP